MAHYQSSLISRRGVIAVLLLVAPASVVFALLTGSVPIPRDEWWRGLNPGAGGLYHSLIYQLRLPRALCAFTTGGLLALAGALMQVLLRNPLADPYILGVSGGAAVGSLLAMVASVGGLAMHVSAFTGALLSILLVFGLARRGGSWTATRLLLTGVVVAAGWGAVISCILAVSPAASLHGMLFWLMGDLGNSHEPVTSLVILAAGLCSTFPVARHLNVLSQGELRALGAGIEPGPLQIYLYLLASLLTAAAVTMAGSIGFIGLVVPHLLRLIMGSDQRTLLPAAVLLGGSLLVVADTLARTVLAPQQLPVGILTAAIGVPLFLYLLNQEHA